MEHPNPVVEQQKLVIPTGCYTCKNRGTRYTMLDEGMVVFCGKYNKYYPEILGNACRSKN